MAPGSGGTPASATGGGSTRAGSPGTDESSSAPPPGPAQSATGLAKGRVGGPLPTPIVVTVGDAPPTGVAVKAPTGRVATDTNPAVQPGDVDGVAVPGRRPVTPASPPSPLPLPTPPDASLSPPPSADADMYSPPVGGPRASVTAAAAASELPRLEQLIRERAGLEPHRGMWPATWALLEGEVARLCRLANAAGTAASLAAGGGGGGMPNGVGGGSRPAVAEPHLPSHAGVNSPSADAYGLGGGIAGIPQDVQEVRAAAAAAGGGAHVASSQAGRIWATEQPLSLISSPASAGFHGHRPGEDTLPLLTGSMYGGGGCGDVPTTPYGGSAAPASAPVPLPGSTKQRVRLLVPAERYPEFNFVGRILGPRGRRSRRSSGRRRARS
eukprot:TRINITY_DN2747_c0_g1_i1.p1 TRINITY_DN2747_c0_g1~~TRINITY_DN2747_c0_g1_i1.p1  ORF type:complete len:383 (+),score=83.17 TRINITY_DN2747_c0_g1_i1:220-1368(+)